MTKINKKDHEQIYKYRESGLTLEAIGVIYGVTRERIRQIYEKEKVIHNFLAEKLDKENTKV